MAKGRSPRVSGGAAAQPSERDRIIDAAFSLIARQGWRRLSLAAIAAEADVPILTLYRTFPSKPAILRGFSRRIDEAVLATPSDGDAAADVDERPRDRVFDLLMRRFDALQSHRATLEVLGSELPTEPLTALCVGAGLLRSIGWMLETAGISTPRIWPRRGSGCATTRPTSRRPWRRSTGGCAASSAGSAVAGGRNPMQPRVGPDPPFYRLLHCKNFLTSLGVGPI